MFSLTAAQFCSINATYKPRYGEILGISGDARFPIVACSRCDFVFASLLPSEHFLELVYDEVIDQDRGFLESVRPGWIAHQLELGSILLEALERDFGNEAGLRVLDFGCGYGSLVRALSGPRVECLGYETSMRRLSYMQDENLRATSNTEEVARSGPFHAVLLSDVLEHVPEPRRTLAECRRVLVPRGLLLVNVPMFDGARLRAIRSAVARDELRECEVNPWEHLNYFSPTSLRRLLEGQGFRLVGSSRPVDFGLRPGLQGLRRLGNAAKSLVRFVRYQFGWRPLQSCVCARRSETVPTPVNPDEADRPAHAGEVV